MRCIFHGLTESRFRDTRNLKTTTNLTEKNDQFLQNNRYVNPVDGLDNTIFMSVFAVPRDGAAWLSPAGL